MKYKAGDEVFIRAEITDVCPSSERPYFVAPDKYSVNWVSEDKIIPMGKTYSDGLNDAWELADKLNNMKLADIVEAFGIDIAREEIFKEISPEEALAKIEAYEKEKYVCVGDVVECNGFKGVVLHIFHSGSLNIVYENGIIDTLASVQECEKTGNHIDIESLLKQIGE